jgi:hypothetical protein
MPAIADSENELVSIALRSPIIMVLGTHFGLVLDESCWYGRIGRVHFCLTFYFRSWLWEHSFNLVSIQYFFTVLCWLVFRCGRQ